MHDIAEFLGAHDPFTGLDEAVLEEMAGRVQVEFFAAGDTVIPRGQPVEDGVRVVRRGAVELIDGDTILDLFGEGELFGHPSMLGGPRAEFEARAHEDSLCYLVPAEDVIPLLATRAGMGQLARAALLGGRSASAGAAGVDVAHRTARSLVRAPALVCSPDRTLREAAGLMGEKGVSSVLVRSERGELGIVTDHDLRARVVAEGVSAEAPVREVMTRSLVTVGPEASGAEVMLAMIDHDIRHLPVLSPDGEPLGVIVGIDLIAAEASAPFVLRRSIARARSAEQLREAARGLPAAVVAMHRSQLGPAQVSRVISVVADAVMRRAIELALARVGPAPVEFAWLSLGSHGRREAVPSSDVDSGMSWRDPVEGRADGAADQEADAVRDGMRSLADSVADCLRAVGWELDAHGVTASGDFSASSIGEWRSAIEGWMSRPAAERVLIAILITLDARVVYGPEKGLDPKAFLYEEENRDLLLALMLRSALASKPPTGFFRDIVVESGGEHRGTLDIKQGGLLPVIDLARHAALKAGSHATTTVERLRSAAEAGGLEASHAQTLEQAYTLFAGLRLEHQVQQLESGQRPDDHLDPGDLSSLTRRHLRDAFREVAAVQRALGAELDRGRGRI